MPPLSDGQIARSLQKRLSQSLATPQGPFFWAGWQDGATGQVGRVQDASGRIYTGIVRGNEQPRDGAAVRYVPGDVPIIVVQDIPEVSPQVGGGEDIEQVAVLYSIVKTDVNNNQYREFWLAIPNKDDVLIDTIYPYFEVNVGLEIEVFLSDSQDAGVQASWSASASLTANSFPSGTTNVFQIIEGDESELSKSGSGSIYRDSSLNTTWAGDLIIDDENPSVGTNWVDTARVIYFTNALSLTQTGNVSGSATNLNNASGGGDTGVDLESGNAAVRINVDGQSDGYTESDSDTWTRTEGPFSNITMNAEGYLSTNNGLLTVLIKSQLLFSEWISVRYGEPGSLTEYTQYINETDLQPLANGDWRQPIVNEDPSDNTGVSGCQGEFLLNSFVHIDNGKLYQLTGSGSQIETALKDIGQGNTGNRTIVIDTIEDNDDGVCVDTFEESISAEVPGIPPDAELLSAIYAPEFKVNF